MVDVEVVVQEALLRMWILAPTLELAGENASLRYALKVARNLALAEARRQKHEVEEREVEVSVEPQPPPDRGLREAIRRCLAALTNQPAVALRARLRWGALHSDRAIAERVGMKLNTFLQNVGRARGQVERCLRRGGIDVGELHR